MCIRTGGRWRQQATALHEVFRMRRWRDSRECSVRNHHILFASRKAGGGDGLSVAFLFLVRNVEGNPFREFRD